MKRTLVLTLALSAALAGCGGSSTATLASSGCSASDAGTKDLATKPVYTVPTAAAPTATTTTDIVCGTGPAAKAGSAVVAKYVGVNYLTGEEFDSSWKRGPN